MTTDQLPAFDDDEINMAKPFGPHGISTGFITFGSMAHQILQIVWATRKWAHGRWYTKIKTDDILAQVPPEKEAYARNTIFELTKYGLLHKIGKAPRDSLDCFKPQFIVSIEPRRIIGRLEPLTPYEYNRGRRLRRAARDKALRSVVKTGANSIFQLAQQS